MSTTKNVFSEFGLSDDAATVEAWRSDLARIIREYFSRSQLSQTAFAKKLGIKQSVVSRIINSRLAGLSIEFLLRLCVKLETRGYAAWGPSPNEAFATSEAVPVGTTATVVVDVRSTGWEASADVPIDIFNKTHSRVARSH